MNTTDAVNLFLQSRQAKGLSPITVKWYKEILERFSGYSKVLPQKPDKIEEFMIGLDVGDERRHGYFRCLKCFYRFLSRRHLSRNPMAYIEQPKIKVKEPRILMPEDIDRVLRFSHDAKIKAALLVLIDAGPRLDEIATLSHEALLETPEGFIAFVKGKTGTRAIPISYETYHALMVNLPFGYKKGWLGQKIVKSCRAAGVNASALTFRHTFGTLWNGDELVLQQIMGHTTLTTTKRYRHLRFKNMILQHNQFSPLKMVLGASKAML